MCGLAGLFDTSAEARPPDRRVLEAMTGSLRHRGPDQEGFHTEAGVGLGHRRLAIIDLGGGVQPLYNEDGAVVVVFNGEIYNFQELMTTLTALGHHFRTRSDTEVIVHAWESWGESCVERFRGMFALALWDRRQQKFFLARDPLGIKPLHYALLPNGWLIFASELKGLTLHKAFSGLLDPRALSAYLTLGYVPDPLTIYAAAHKLPPAHRLVVTPGGGVPSPSCYWEAPVPGDMTPPAGFAEALEALRQRLQEVVRSHQVSDVPLGCFLSGGVDSSAVTALMARDRAEPVQACTMAFADARFDERDHAARVARHCGVIHHVEEVTPAHLPQAELLTGLFDEPFADASALPTWRVCALARKHVKVVLSGDGGDETLGGYDRYRQFLREDGLRRHLPGSRPLFRLLGAWYPRLDGAPRPLRLQAALQSLGEDFPGGYLRGMSLLPPTLLQTLQTPALARSLQGFAVRDLLSPHDRPGEEPLHRLQHLDLKTFLAGRVLVKVDRASMAHGLEVRVPFLDHAFVSWGLALPARWKIHGGSGKWLLKKLLEELVPPEVVHRPKKGFNIPLRDWLRGPLQERVRRAWQSEAVRQTGWVEPGAVLRLLDRHVAAKGDYSASLWALWMLALFLERQVSEG
ncbi:MAG: amidotransferase 1, exosortase A system-associated [Magnetococcales bacterium]|nr:amidotransferase 1, exosortase A system-associated [Magnetococcales bacterium]